MKEIIKPLFFIFLLCAYKINAQQIPLSKPDGGPYETVSAKNERALHMCLNFYVNGGWGQNSYTYGRSLATVYGSFGAEYKNLISFSANIGFGSMGIKSGHGPIYSNVNDVTLYTYYIVQGFLEIKAIPVKGNISPIAYIDVGGGTGVFSVSIASGTLVRAGAGFRFKSTDHLNVELSCNYHYQELAYTGNGNHYNYTSDVGKLYMAYCAAQLGIIYRLK